ncbi:23S rRNA (pseudouridine(1915)-N(3))-methyltransferase RlmH [Thermodesulforhabdus norvegica]|uniref:Ribosomal RNA large subunit methyltransferase H n=1 Tax=Thermodesulforhabdus norvegica TaxID=39841 RepID=A0A1I4SAX3_9BACT|nr:23S rRNA (pseudouridine(1915)-N(3))-methyltransferase RlmH [Thermodesulforhabdus norvegica]SFM61615.1 23S rRNA (pseudouridine1915-N3)-methyltransferase [Thermodesulforhabdus norvegica]
MKLNFIFVGKTGHRDMGRLIKFYADRLARFTRIEIKTVREEKITSSKTPELILQAEGKRILDATDPSDVLVVWDSSGEMMSSVEYAEVLGAWERQGIKRVSMVIGGPLGIGSEVKKAAQKIFSLSPMTFPHDLARVIVLEQTYRAFSIIRGIPYHK